MKKLTIILIFLSTLLSLVSGKIVSAQQTEISEISTPEIPQNLCTIPLQLELLENPDLANHNPHHIVTADTISQEYLATPSLWWAKQQFDSFKGKLIRNWLAYPEENRIDLIVNRQLWSLMNYLDRYRLINQFGTVSRSYGYNLRIVNQYQECLATYQLNQNQTIAQWEINFYSVDENSLQL